MSLQGSFKSLHFRRIFAGVSKSLNEEAVRESVRVRMFHVNSPRHQKQKVASPALATVCQIEQS